MTEIERKEVEERFDETFEDAGFLGDAEIFGEPPYVRPKYPYWTQKVRNEIKTFIQSEIESAEKRARVGGAKEMIYKVFDILSRIKGDFYKSTYLAGNTVTNMREIFEDINQAFAELEKENQ